MNYFIWACMLGAISAVSLPLGSWIGLRYRFGHRSLAIMAAFGAGALLAALSVELIAPTSLALVEGGAGHRDENLAAFLAMIAGCVGGGLTYVSLNKLVNRRGGFLRKTSTLLSHYEKQDMERRHEILDRLSQTPPFQNFPPEHIETLMAAFEPVDFKKDDVIIEEGAPAEALYLLISGSASAWRGDNKLADVTPEFALAGIVPVLGGTANLVTLTADSDARALRLKADDFDDLRALAPAFDTAARDLASSYLEHYEDILSRKAETMVSWSKEARKSLTRKAVVPTAPAMQKMKEKHEGAPIAIWLGILLDGIPESLVIGAGMMGMLSGFLATGEAVRFINVIPFTLIAGLFLSNFPEALSSSANMLAQGWGKTRIFVMWFSLMVITALGAGAGYLLAGSMGHTWVVLLEGLAAGAMLTMIAAAMIPEAVVMGGGNLVGLSTLGGFLAAVLFKLFE